MKQTQKRRQSQGCFPSDSEAGAGISGSTVTLTRLPWHTGCHSPPQNAIQTWNKKQVWRNVIFMPEQWILAPSKSQKFHLCWINASFQSSFFGTKQTTGLRNSPSSPSASLEEKQVFNYFSLGKFLFKDVRSPRPEGDFQAPSPWREHWHCE